MYNYYYDALALWNYHHLNQKMIKSDYILVFGSHDLHVADRAVELYQQNQAKYIIFTGGFGRITKTIWQKPEAEMFSEIAVKAGIPKERIIVEKESSNTGENIAYTKKILAERGLLVKNIIAVDKPYKERRLYATLKKQWAELSFVITSPQNSFDEYIEYYTHMDNITVKDFVDIMVGDLQRIDYYGKNGYQIEQKIPTDVKAAYDRLVINGYDGQLLQI